MHYEANNVVDEQLDLLVRMTGLSGPILELNKAATRFDMDPAILAFALAGSHELLTEEDI